MYIAPECAEEWQEVFLSSQPICNHLLLNTLGREGCFASFKQEETEYVNSVSDDGMDLSVFLELLHIQGAGLVDEGVPLTLNARAVGVKRLADADFVQT